MLPVTQPETDTALRPADPATPVPPLPPRRPSRGWSILALVAAIVLLLIGLGAGGGALLQASEGGHFGTKEYRFTSQTSTLKTDEIEVGSSSARPDDPDMDIGELAEVRIKVRSVDPNAWLFIGIGPKQDVEDFLRGTAYDEFTGAQLDPFRADFRRVSGSQQPADPSAESFWVASATGTGTQKIAWDKSQGAWSFVVMRLDGGADAGVDVHGSVGLRFGFLPVVSVAFLVAGAALLAGVIAHRVARRRTA